MVLIDYATRYPEAIPLRSTKAPVIAAVTEDLCPFRISLRSNNWPGDQLDESCRTYGNSWGSNTCTQVFITPNVTGL